MPGRPTPDLGRRPIDYRFHVMQIIRSPNNRFSAMPRGRAMPFVKGAKYLVTRILLFFRHAIVCMPRARGPEPSALYDRDQRSAVCVFGHRPAARCPQWMP